MLRLVIFLPILYLNFLIRNNKRRGVNLQVPQRFFVVQGQVNPHLHHRFHREGSRCTGRFHNTRELRGIRYKV